MLLHANEVMGFDPWQVRLRVLIVLIIMQFGHHMQSGQHGKHTLNRLLKHVQMDQAVARPTQPYRNGTTIPFKDPYVCSWAILQVGCAWTVDKWAIRHPKPPTGTALQMDQNSGNGSALLNQEKKGMESMHDLIHEQARREILQSGKDKQESNTLLYSIRWDRVYDGADMKPCNAHAAL
ncbi:hypothetical protein VNO77_02608 [Canavalia gladiata]|uniref:Uncharacterized protein n=1 Tax=Canavalia gladiata TaxID=3824 RepID=A0AAN9MU29_CANGL